MPQYSVYMEHKQAGRVVHSISFNVGTYDEVLTGIIQPYIQKKAFLVHNSVYNPKDVNRLEIICSEKHLYDLRLPDGRRLTVLGSQNIFINIFQGHIKDAYVNTQEFYASLNSIKQQQTKTMVFIVHGRKKEPALELQKFLSKRKIEAKIFDDLREEKTGNTIIEILEFVRDNVGYALIIATPDDIGGLDSDIKEYERQLLCKEKFSRQDMETLLSQFRTRSRQNVVFEYGLFLGALGRERVCCLLNNKIIEKPSDIDGILYVSFGDSITDAFREIETKLQNANIGSDSLQ
jgi:predicted nucleotide-binding protein